jgi:heme exporter protein D
MSFTSVGEFLAMGQHGLYVWLSFGAGFIIAAYNVVSVRVRRRRFFREAWDQQRRESALQERPTTDESQTS